MESLICKFLLWKTGLSTGEEYNEKLDKMFLENSKSSLFLELESFSSNCDATFDILKKYWDYDCKEFSVETFGANLCEDLKTVYFSNLFPITEFGKKCYGLWQMLPNEILVKEPFHSLSYADDPLSWGDEEQTRKLYENFFNFYN